MIAGVADTHTALWYLLRNPRLSVPARNFIDSAAEAGNDIVLSPISLAEIVYLTEKNRLPVSAYEASFRVPKNGTQGDEKGSFGPMLRGPLN